VSQKEAADEMCLLNIQGAERESAAEENKTLIGQVGVDFLMCTRCNNWAMRFGRSDEFGQYEKVAHVRKKFRTNMKKARARGEHLNSTDCAAISYLTASPPSLLQTSPHAQSQMWGHPQLALDQQQQQTQQQQPQQQQPPQQQQQQQQHQQQQKQQQMDPCASGENEYEALTHAYSSS
jgi:hypothetical protein